MQSFSLPFFRGTRPPRCALAQICGRRREEKWKALRGSWLTHLLGEKPGALKGRRCSQLGGNPKWMRKKRERHRLPLLLSTSQHKPSPFNSMFSRQSPESCWTLDTCYYIYMIGVKAQDDFILWPLGRSDVNTGIILDGSLPVPCRRTPIIISQAPK